MRNLRLILSIALSILMGASSLASKAAGSVLYADDSRDCCKSHDNGSKSMPAKNPGESGRCLLPCCTIVTMHPQTAPALLSDGGAVEMTAIASAALHSLTELDALFHPPRA